LFFSGFHFSISTMVWNEAFVLISFMRNQTALVWTWVCLWFVILHLLLSYFVLTRLFFTFFL
jgi:hypothetical protein